MKIPGNPLDKKNIIIQTKHVVILFWVLTEKKQGRTNAFHDNIFLYLT